MKKSKIIIFFFLITLIKTNDPIEIDFSNTLETTADYTVEGNTIILSNENGNYILSGTSSSHNVKVSSSCTLNLNSLDLYSPTSAPLLIEQNKIVSLILTGVSSLTDSTSNQNEGVIYLNKESKLIISGEGILSIQPNKFMAINGTESSSLTVNSGTINILSTTSGVGGIYLRKEIIFNNGNFNFNINIRTSNNEKPPHAIDTEGSITLKKGKYYIISGEGKGLQAEKNLYIGTKNDDDDNLELNIQTNNEGIEAKGIEIYSGIINIIAKGDGINAANDACNSNCRGNCDCYMKFEGGNIKINSEEDGLDSNGDININGGQIIVLGASSGDNQPIDQDGLLSISGGTILAGGTSSMGGVQATTTQAAGVYVKHVDAGAKLTIFNENNEKIIEIEAPKAVEYLYFCYPGKSFTMKLNDNQIEIADPSTVQGQKPGPSRKPDDENSNNNSYFLRLSNILILFTFIIN